MCVCGQNKSAVFDAVTKGLHPDTFPLVHHVAIQILEIGIRVNWNRETSLQTYAGVKVSFCSTSHEFFPVFVPTAACQTIVLTMVHFDPKLARLISDLKC